MHSLNGYNENKCNLFLPLHLTFFRAIISDKIRITLNTMTLYKQLNNPIFIFLFI